MSDLRYGDVEYTRPKLKTAQTKRPSFTTVLHRAADWVVARRADVAGGFVLLVGLALGLSLGSASALDEPTLTWPVAESSENLMGATGAWVAGRLLYWLGLAAFLPSFALIGLGLWMLLRDAPGATGDAALTVAEDGRELERWHVRFVEGLRAYAVWVVVGASLMLLGVAGAGGDAAPLKPHSPALGGVLGLALFDGFAALGGAVAARIWLSLLAVVGLVIAAWPFLPQAWRAGQLGEASGESAATGDASALAAQRSAAASSSSQSGEQDVTEILELDETAQATAQDLLAPTRTDSMDASPMWFLEDGEVDDDDADQPGEYDTSDLQLPSSASYALPPLSLLPKGPRVWESRSETSWRHAEQETAVQLVEALAAVHLAATLTRIERGPSVVSYELELAASARVPQLAALEHELSLALRDGSVRVLAAAGKGRERRLRVELPRHDREEVSLRKLATEAKRDIRKAELPLILGRDRVGKPLIADLARTGPLLIAAANDAAKSHTTVLTVLSLLLAKRPDEVQLVLIDPNGRALDAFDDVPHVRRERVRDIQQAVAALYELVAELARRKRTAEEEEQAESRARPAIVVVIDELADLLLGPSREVAGLVHRLASEGAAWGIYLVVATHRPSVDVCTHAVKAGFAARLALRLASTLDSRLILDEPGAQQLLEHGDALVRLDATSELVRCQIADVEPEAIEAIVAHLRKQPRPQRRRSNRNSSATATDPRRHESNDAAASASATCSSLEVPIAVVREQLRMATHEEPDTQAFVADAAHMEVDAEIDPNAETVVDEPLLLELVPAEVQQWLATMEILPESETQEVVFEPIPMASADRELAMWDAADSAAWQRVALEEEEAVAQHALPVEATDIVDLELDAELDAWNAATANFGWADTAEALEADPFAEAVEMDDPFGEDDAFDDNGAPVYDLFFAAAIRLARDANGCSVALLQSELGLNDADAEEMLWQLEQAQIIEPGSGSSMRRLRTRQAG